MNTLLIDAKRIAECKAAAASVVENLKATVPAKMDAAAAALVSNVAVLYAVVPALLSEREALLALLREVESRGDVTGTAACCPLCGGPVRSYWSTPDSLVQHRVDHEADCRLAAFLGGEPQ